MILVIGDYPAQSDLDNGTYMQSLKEKVLWYVLKEAVNADLNEVVPVYLFDRNDTGKYTPKEIKEAVAAMQDLIAEQQPLAVVTMGDLVNSSLLGIKDLRKARGKVITQEFNGELVKFIPVYSPAYVQNAQVHLETFAKDLYKAWLINLGKEEEDKGNTILCTTVEEVIQAFDYCIEVGVCCFDFETTKLTDKETFDEDFKVTLLSVSFQHGSSYAIPLYHFQSPFSDAEVKAIMQYFFDNIMSNYDVDKVAHNAKFDLHVCARLGMQEYRGRLDDTMLMHHLLDETKRHGLKDITMSYFPNFGGYEDDVAQYDWAKVPLKILAPYAGTDTDLTLRFRTQFLGELMEDERLYRIYRNLTIPALKALFEAEERGMLIDREMMEANIEEATAIQENIADRLQEYPEVKRLTAVIREELTTAKIEEIEEKKLTAKGKRLENYELKLQALKTGVEVLFEKVNFASVPQLGRLLYTPDGFNFKKPYVKAKGGHHASTGKEFLEDLNDESGFVADLLLYRSIGKTLSTYLHGINDRLDSNSRVHTTFMLHGTASGRLSSRNPNLQNLTNVAKLKDPTAIKVVSMVKQPFAVPEGYTLVQVDYSQAELRIIASFAQERNMMDAYDKGIDLHALYASKMLNTTLEAFYELDKNMQKQWRTRAKAGNFGLIYGMSAEGLVSYAKNNYGVILTLDEATTMRNDFFDMYPRLLDYHATYIAKGRKFGHVRTLYGRTRKLLDINDSSEYVRAADERVAINSPIQGTAGEFTLFAIALLRNRLDKRTQFVNTVHDSIVFYIPDNLLDSEVEVIKNTCENLPNVTYFGKALKGMTMQVDVEISKKSYRDLEPYEVK